MGTERSRLQSEVVKALIESKAIDFEAVAQVFGKFAAQAALDGDSLVSLITKNVTWNCGWPVPVYRGELVREELAHQAMR